MKISTTIFIAAGLFLSTSALSQEKSLFKKGIVYENEDKTLKMKFGLRIQSLFSTNFRDYEVLDNPNLVDTYFGIRRGRLKFDGYAGSPKWEYKLELALGNRNLGSISEFTNMGAQLVLDAVVKYHINDKYTVWVGQTKLPGNRERVVSSQKLQFVDRNLANSRYNLDRDQGVQIRGKEMLFGTHFNWAVAASMGEGRNITANNFGGYEYTVHADWLPLGKFASKGDYSQSDLAREKKPKLAIGATYDRNNGAARVRSNQGNWIFDSTGTINSGVDLDNYIVDYMFKYNGWSSTGEFFHRTASQDPRVLDADGSVLEAYYIGQGVNAQVGYLFKSNWEVAGRYSAVFPDSRSDERGDYAQYTLGVSKYIYGHTVKIQSDVSYTEYSDIKYSDPLMFRVQLEVGF